MEIDNKGFNCIIQLNGVLYLKNIEFEFKKKTFWRVATSNETEKQCFRNFCSFCSYFCFYLLQSVYEYWVALLRRMGRGLAFFEIQFEFNVQRSFRGGLVLIFTCAAKVGLSFFFCDWCITIILLVC